MRVAEVAVLATVAILVVLAWVLVVWKLVQAA